MNKTKKRIGMASFLLILTLCVFSGTIVSAVELTNEVSSNSIFSIIDATNDVKTDISSDSKDRNSLEEKYGTLNIPSTILVYDAVSFSKIKLNKEKSNSLKVSIYGKEYNMILERMNLENIDDGIDSYSGYISGVDNSVVLFTFDESMDKSIVHGYINLNDETLYIVPVQNRENGLQTSNPLHIIYSSKNVAQPTEEEIKEIQKQTGKDADCLIINNQTAKQPIKSNDNPQKSPNSWATVTILVATDNEFYNLETNWVSSAQSYMNQLAYQYQRPDIEVIINVVDYDDSKKNILSDGDRQYSEPLFLFKDTFPISYLNSKNADIAIYLSGVDANDDAQGLAWGYKAHDTNEIDKCRYAWSQMVADWYLLYSLVYDGSYHARTYCVIHELGHIFNADHENSQGINKAYTWIENAVRKYTVMQSGYFGSDHNTWEYSSPNYNGDNTHNNAAAIRTVKHNVATYI